jgi:hypothetical protein
MSESQLMEYFKFDTDDLYANQNGRFTEKQKVRLTQLDKSRRKAGLGMGIFLALIGLIGPIIAIVAGIQNPDLAFIIGFGLGFGIVWPLVWGGIGYLMIKGAVEKRAFKVASVQGRANIVARESRSTDSDGHTSTRIYHELHIGGVTFGVNRNIADVIFQGDEYIIYYVEATRDIISVEGIGKKK